MRAFKSLLLIIIISLISGCQDYESTIKKTLKRFDILLDNYIAYKNKPDSKNLQNKLAVYISKNKNNVANMLEDIYEFRFENPVEFRNLYKKNKGNIINVLRKMEMLDKNDKIIFRYFSFVFSPEILKKNMESFALKKRLFIKYCDLLEELAKNKI